MGSGLFKNETFVYKIVYINGLFIYFFLSSYYKGIQKLNSEIAHFKLKVK